MSRRAYNVQHALPGLVLDLPLYSASMEHMTDRCGHTLYGFGDGMAAWTATEGGLTGIQIPGVYSLVPQWVFEPIADNCFTYSYFFYNENAAGHGWAWECLTYGGGEETVCFSNAITARGVKGRLCVGWLDSGGPEFSYSPTAIHFVTAVVEGTVILLYVDGVLVAAGEHRKCITFDCVGLRWSVEDMFNSSMAVFRQFKLFRRTLTADEVAALYVEEQKYLTAV